MAINETINIVDGMPVSTFSQASTNNSSQQLNQGLTNLGNNQTFNNTSDIISKLRGVLGVQQKSQTTETLNQAYDAVANGAAMFFPVGTAISGAMKVGAFVGDGLTAMGLGTDQMTTTDQILDSNFMKLSIPGLINAAGAKKSDTIIADQETISGLGASYGGSVNKIEKSLSKSGKKYGFFSSGSRRKANKQIREAERQQNIMQDINQDRNRELLLAQDNLLGNTYQLNMFGGPEVTRAAKLGAKIDFVKKLDIRNKKIYKIPENKSSYFKDGGSFEYKLFKRSLKQNAPYLIENDDFNMERYWELNGKPKNWNEAVLKKLFEISDDGKYHAYTIAWNENGEGEWMKSSNHPTIKYEEAWFDGYSLDKDGNKIPLEGKELEKWKEFKEKYYLEEIEGKRKYKPKFKEGGVIKGQDNISEQPNVIPEGALHKNKHHIEGSDDWTQKGIPVIDNENKQQAEVECDEIIFNLEVTKKLEELQQKYYEENKDDYAIEAGKLLVDQILYNTDDRTNLIERVDESK